MNQIAFYMENATIYWYSIILALAIGAGICFFMASCTRREIPALAAAETAVLCLVLSLVVSRLLYWNCRSDTFKSLSQALTAPGSSYFALGGAFLACGAGALIMGKLCGSRAKLLDCMSVAGCGAIALGRLGNFFTSADRGRIVEEMTNLPWAYPVPNNTSGLPDYRLATFLFQAILAGILFAVLCTMFFLPKIQKKLKDGDVTLLFLLVYCASQVILDSTRYDSLYLRINGFVSMVQILAAIGLAAAIVLIAVNAARQQGIQKWMIGCWIAVAAFFGGAGYMEYYVQRHSKLAAFAYGTMEHCLIGIIVIGILLLIASRKPVKEQN